MTRLCISRTEHPDFLIGVANDPRVRPWLGGDDPVDLARLVTDPKNIALTTSRGGFLALAVGGGRYHVHALFRPGGGQHAVRAMREALRFVFTETDATELYAGIPYRNRAARALARIAGFEPRLCYVLPWTGTTSVRAEMSVLTITAWMQATRRKGH